MSQPVPPTILVIVGISGDLAHRKLLPALAQMARAGALPEQFRVVGISRQALEPAAVIGAHTELAPLVEVFQMNLAEAQEYQHLAERLAAIEAEFGAPTQRLFYLSVPPQVSQPIVEQLGAAGLAGNGAKLLLEKPFGTDLTSAQDFIAHTQRYFAEDQIYRIDHYLAKEMAQNLLIFRGSNALFQHTWHRDFIERIEILASETIGIEGRAAFYEQTGAMRDLVQSHLLQLAALTLMEVPPASDWSLVHQARLAALEALRPPRPDEFGTRVQRGQYRGYRAEVNNPGSVTETFLSLTLSSVDPRWSGVPITLTTGKALDRKATEIRLYYRQNGDPNAANQLILRIQPHEGIELCLWAKRPGYDRQLQRVPLDFTYSHHFDGLPEAYERVLMDAIRSDRSLFASSDEVLASWRILAPLQHAWSLSDEDLRFYEPGSTPDTIIAN